MAGKPEQFQRGWQQETASQSQT